MAHARRCVVTGVGIVSPIGTTTKDAWTALVAARQTKQNNNHAATEPNNNNNNNNAPSYTPYTPPPHTAVTLRKALAKAPVRIAAALPDSWNLAHNNHLYRRGDEQTLARFSQLALAAAAQALRHADYSPDADAKQRRAGVAIGSGIGGLAEIVAASNTLNESGARRISPHFIPKMLVNMAGGNVAIRASLRGPSAAPASACATGGHALADALRLIHSGEADVMVAGAAEACIEPLAIAGFSRLRALATGFDDNPGAASRPFDAGRVGFVLGEGAAVLVLEEREHARRRGAVPLAELRAVGVSSDAHHITQPPDSGDGALRAMSEALRLGGVPVGALDYVNAHATSTPQGDLAEARAIDVLARRRPRGAHPLLVSSTKGATGHLLGAAGALEAAFTVLALSHGLIPPTLNLVDPQPDDVSFEHVRGEPRAAPIKTALCNSFGFGGQNASALFSVVDDNRLVGMVPNINREPLVSGRKPWYMA